MSKTIAKVWTFESDSNPDKTYETLQYDDGSTSCNCMGWTRRVAEDGSRSCKHTRMVDQDRADSYCVSSHDYEQRSLQADTKPPVKTKKTVEEGTIKLGPRRILWK